MILFSPGYAVTSPSSQGMTVTGRCVVHQWTSMLNERSGDRRLLYTAVTRLRSMDHLILAKDLAEVRATQKGDEVYFVPDDDVPDTMASGLSVARS